MSLAKERLAKMLRKAGIEPQQQVGVPIVFLINEIAAKDPTARKLSHAFKEEVVRLLKNVRFNSPLSAIVLFPQITKQSSIPENITYKRDGAVYVNLNVSYTEWVKSSEAVKIDLLSANIYESIRRIKETRLSASDKTKLLDIVESARMTLRDKALS